MYSCRCTNISIDVFLTSKNVDPPNVLLEFIKPNSLTSVCWSDTSKKESIVKFSSLHYVHRIAEDEKISITSCFNCSSYIFAQLEANIWVTQLMQPMDIAQLSLCPVFDIVVSTGITSHPVEQSFKDSSLARKMEIACSIRKEEMKKTIRAFEEIEMHRFAEYVTEAEKNFKLLSSRIQEGRRAAASLCLVEDSQTAMRSSSISSVIPQTSNKADELDIFEGVDAAGLLIPTDPSIDLSSAPGSDEFNDKVGLSHSPHDEIDDVGFLLSKSIPINIACRRPSLATESENTSAIANTKRMTHEALAKSWMDVWSFPEQDTELGPRPSRACSFLDYSMRT